jgi:CheY-like chemotaxis protein
VIDLNQVVRELDDMLGRLLGEHIERELRLDPALPAVRADRRQLEQGIVALAVNSLDAMPQGGKLVLRTNAALRPSGGDSPRLCVSLIVEDTGTGMSPEVLAHACEPFFTTKPAGKGSGLGLSTVFGIVKQSGGELLLRSEAGKGTAVEILLPAIEKHPAPAPRVSSGAARTGPARILLVEDEDGLRRLLGHVLTREGYQVTEAADGEEALATFDRSRDFDLLITDVVMPRRSGPEVAAELRRRAPALKVLYISGYAGDIIAEHGLLEPESSFLSKPFTPTAALRKVREILHET